MRSQDNIYIVAEHRMRRSEALESGSRKREPCLGSAMYRLACCLLFLGCLQPLLSLPAPGARAGPLQLSGKRSLLPCVCPERAFSAVLERRLGVPA